MGFVVIENYSHEHKFEDFSKDYKNGMTKADLRKKYDIPPSVWFEWKERLPPRMHSKNRRPKKPRRVRAIEDWKIRANIVGTYTVYRRWKGAYYSYGTYPSKNIAVDACGLLVESKWDTDLAVKLVRKYGVTISKKCLLSHIYERDERMKWND